MTQLQSNLINAREKMGMTQRDVAKNTGIKREYLSKMENGHLENPTLGTLIKLARAYVTTASKLIEGVK